MAFFNLLESEIPCLSDHGWLAGSLVIADDCDDGLFVFLSPRDNACSSRAVEEYRGLLTYDSMFADRYLDIGRTDDILRGENT